LREIKVGEYVIVPHDRKHIFIGRVTGEAFNDPSATSGGFKRSVHWLNSQHPIAKADDLGLFNALKEQPTCYELNRSYLPVVWQFIQVLDPAAKKASMEARGSTYRSKIPMVRNWLIRIAQARTKVAYSDVMTVFEMDRFTLRHVMGVLGRQARDNEEPIITALIVGKTSGVCSRGLKEEFGVLDDGVERERLYAYWEDVFEREIETMNDEGDLGSQALQFASVASRPQQAAFRRRVYMDWGGKCAITGCSVRRALDAAHKHGRDWKLGHNNACDGLLLRKDLHAIYDAKLLNIDDGRVTLHDEVMEHYAAFDGLALRQPR
jgi:hypothetical protein